VWLCSRNDVIANVAVLAAAAGVGLTGAAWPDVAVGVGIALLFGSSAVSVLRAGTRHLRESAPA
jgi:Co/Zn/Cd efflux system component